MEDKELIKAEIERLKDVFEDLDGDCLTSSFKAGGKKIANELLSFIDSLPKEQVDPIEEAGYEWNEEKKGLKLLITNGGDFLESENCKQKSAWSEEDEKMLNRIICDIESIKEEVVYCKAMCNEEIDWMKSLKDRLK